MGSTFIRHPIPSPVTSNTVIKPISSRQRAIDTAFALKSPEGGDSPTPSSSSQTGVKKTKGGDYPVYKKDSADAQAFGKAFAAARKSGKKKFSWNGRSYTTNVA